jgi:hypothetical protein
MDTPFAVLARAGVNCPRWEVRVRLAGSWCATRHARSTTCTVTVSEPGREFCFVVGTPEKPKTAWSYRFAVSGSGTDVTESWQAERYGFVSRLMTKPGRATAVLNDGIAKTLGALQRAGGSD